MQRLPARVGPLGRPAPTGLGPEPPDQDRYRQEQAELYQSSAPASARGAREIPDEMAEGYVTGVARSGWPDPSQVLPEGPARDAKQRPMQWRRPEGRCCANLEPEPDLPISHFWQQQVAGNEKDDREGAEQGHRDRRCRARATSRSGHDFESYLPQIERSGPTPALRGRSRQAPKPTPNITRFPNREV